MFPPEGIVTFGATPAPMPKRDIVVATYNVGYGSGVKNNKDAATREETQKNLAEIVAALRRLNPDLIALQEVDFNSRRSFGIDQFRYLAEQLGMPYGAYVVTWNQRYIPYPYWPPRLHFGRVLSGQAILSRFPIRSHETKTLPKPEANPFWYNWFYLNRVLEKAVVDLGGEEAAFWNVHLEAFQGATRLQQAETLGAWVAADSRPLKWAAGDFNSVSVYRPGLNAEEVAALEDKGEALQAFAQLTGMSLDPPDPAKLSFSSTDPVKKLDHIFHTPSLELLESGVDSAVQGSDHLPVWARFRRP